MVKMYTAFTRQIDDPEAAVQEVLEQLKPEENKLKNTVGVVNFYYEFVDTEVCKAIADALPFDVVGCVSAYVSTAEEHGDIALTVTMLTSDDATFAIQVLEDISGKSTEQIAEEVTRMCKELCAEETPKLIMPFLPMGPHFSGDNLVDTVNALPEPLPLYGTIAFNANFQGESVHHVLANDKISSDIHVYLVVYGNVKPEFHVISAFFDFQGKSGVITESEGSILKSVDDMPTLQYLKKQGFVPDGDTDLAASWTLPAVLAYPNGTQVVRAFPGLVEGTEFAWATGSIKTGAQISFAHLDGDKTIDSAAHLVEKLAGLKASSAIIFSCAARAWSLGTRHLAEMQKIAECVAEHRKANSALLNYSLSYSGGEICPVWDNDGKIVNMLHNCTLTACIF